MSDITIHAPIICPIVFTRKQLLFIKSNNGMAMKPAISIFDFTHLITNENLKCNVINL